jgi:transposase-like protein
MDEPFSAQAVSPHPLPAAPRRQRRRWSNEERAALVGAWRQSGSSKLHFCQEHTLCYASFLRWVAQEADAGGAPLVEVRLEEPAAAGALELVAPNGWRVRLAAGFAADPLRAVVRLLSQC